MLINIYYGLYVVNVAQIRKLATPKASFLPPLPKSHRLLNVAASGRNVVAAMATFDSSEATTRKIQVQASSFSQANNNTKSSFRLSCINIAQRILLIYSGGGLWRNSFLQSQLQSPNPKTQNKINITTMEALLNLAFDNLSSYDQGKIRKGLRQIDGLLAEVCLSSASPKSAAEKRRSVIDPGKEPPPLKPLNELGSDPAFREFFKLQDGFEWNVAIRLITCLDRLLGKSNDGQNDLLIIQTLDLIQGTLLLHPPSRSLFSRELYMNVRSPSRYDIMISEY